MKLDRRFIALCFACLLPVAVYAEAPVVEESENFAILDQNAAADEQPLAQEQIASNDRYSRPDQQSIDREYNDEQPLARDTTPTNSNSSLLNEIQSLKQEIQELRGQLEIQMHELSVLKEQQLSFYKDLDARLRGTSAPNAKTTPVIPEPSTPAATPMTSKPAISAPKKVIPVPVAVTAPSPSNNPAEEQIRYLAAYDLIKTKRFPEAITAMQSFADQYPKGGYTANAHYWLGELYMTQKDYPQAISHFDTVLQQFPSSSKSAPSLLKMGYALEASGKKQEAMARLKEVIQRYPDTQTAKLAGEKLRMLGH